MTTNKDHQKGVFVTIIVLLVIFLPLSVFSFVLHLMNEPDAETKQPDNPTHQFQYNGSLYFYNLAGVLIGKYDCQNKNGVCDYATSSTDDKLYSVDYYPNEDAKITSINNRYAFLVDSESLSTAKPFLYDIVNGRIITTYSSVKNYGLGIENDLFIVGNDSLKYGVLSLKQDPVVKVKFDFDYLGIANFINDDENKLMSDFFVGYKDKTWVLLDMNGAILTDALSREIVSYNGKNIITKDDSGYYLVDYQDNILLPNGPFQKLSFTGKYLNIYDFNQQFYVYDIVSSNNISTPITIRSSDKVSSRINEVGNLEVIQNEKIVETIPLP